MMCLILWRGFKRTWVRRQDVTVVALRHVYYNYDSYVYIILACIIILTTHIYLQDSHRSTAGKKACPCSLKLGLIRLCWQTTGQTDRTL